MTRRQIPNTLTIARLVLAAACIALLAVYRYPHGSDAVLWAAILVFVVAAMTDWLDGYLARRWQVISAFGRIVDPLADKLLVLGSMVMLVGPAFLDDAGQPATGLWPWMVVVILARELMVTAIRGELESMGIKFPAIMSGKLKATLQMIAVPVLLWIVWLDPNAPGHAWARWLRDALVWATVLATAASGLPYIAGAARALRKGRG